jgi:hypothetical protein
MFTTAAAGLTAADVQSFINHSGRKQMKNDVVTIQQHFFSEGNIDPNTFNPTRNVLEAQAAPSPFIRYTTGLFSVATGTNGNKPLVTGFLPFLEPGHIVASPLRGGKASG